MTVTVAAGGARAEPMTSAQRQQMMEHYERATRAYDIQKYQEAVDEYQKAYEVAGDPAMLYNVAQALRLGEQLPEALHAYRRYLQRSPTARNREDVERKIAELEKAIEARKKASEAAAAAAARAQPPVQPVPAVTPPAPVAPTPVETGVNKQRVTGIAFLSVGVAALAVSGVSGWLAAKKGDDLTAASMRGEPFDPNIESSGKTFNNVAIATVIGGGALALVGTILLVTSGDDSSERPATTARLLPVVGGGTVGMGAAFSF